MIKLISATPGSGKSLLATDMLLTVCRENVANLKYNYFYGKAFFEKLEQLNLIHYLNSLLVEKGQGLEKTSEIVFFEPDYFDFLKIEYYINVISNPDTDDIVLNFPSYYFERISLLNLIIDKINKTEHTKFDVFKAVRTIYSNIANLKLVQVRPLPPECDWRNTPQGSYFVIDEAQLINIFSDEARGIDPIVKDLTIHRHKGYDFIFITQEPSFVHKYIRKLASHHIHLINIFGWEQSMRMEWSVVQDSPNAVKSIARCESLTRWKFPKHVYNLYTSTTINTREKRIPKKLVIVSIAAAICFIAAILMNVLSGGSNPLVSIITGNPPVEENKIEPITTIQNPQSATQLSGIKPTSSSDIQKKDDPNNVSSASEPVTELSTHQQNEPEYNITNPSSYAPSFTPQVVNARTFSGCFCTKKTCTAYDNQGTKIVGFDKTLCKKIMQDSSERPFDYFTAKNNNGVNNAQLPNQTSTQESNQSTVSQSYQAQNQIDPHLEARTVNGANAL